MEIYKNQNSTDPILSGLENEEQLMEEMRIVYLETKNFLKNYFRGEDFKDFLNCLQEALLKQRP